MSLRETSAAYRGFIRLFELIVSALYCALRSCLASLSRAAGKERGCGGVVLTYHGVSDAQKAKFASQMDHLLKAGQAVFADSSGDASMGRRRIAVTFDDGYANILRNAVPALRERNIPCVVFMTTKYMGEKPGWILDVDNPNRNEPLISAEQLRSLQGELVKIGSHTHSHALLGACDRDTLIDELSLSKKALEGRLSHEVDLLSLPYGSMNPDTLRCSRAAGYRVLFVNVPYPDSMKGDMRVVGRTHVALEDWGIEYRLKLRGAYDWISVTYSAKKNIKRLIPSLARERNG
jgi:peptidoglycan/xylan/chitin deacetylase (PgdA/CDA1 family)